MKITYDRRADVLYLAVTEVESDHSEDHDGVVLRYRNGHLIGITLVDATRFLGAPTAPEPAPSS